MRVLAVEKLGDYCAKVTFARGDDRQDKTVQVSTFSQRAGSARHEFECGINRAAVEANRDMILREQFAKGGKTALKDLRNHPDFCNRFDLADEVLKRID
jgi:hypothetical protein